MIEQKIDVNCDFTNDTPQYWNKYWNDEMGGSFVDPDSKSAKLKYYHSVIWSKTLPNGQKMELKTGSGSKYLTWNNYVFASDSIIASFRYEKYRYMIKRVIDSLADYKSFMEYYTRKSYTIGGSIIFPKMVGSINQKRGWNPFIRDRFDLTLECIRRYYLGEKSPMYETLVKNKNFFDLFINFKGYVDYFYLQDLVSEDYSNVKFWIETNVFEMNPFPKSVEEYLLWISNQLKFVEKRNKRIELALLNNK